LKEELDIPVMHDDQHGTAIISAAGLLNALEVAGKKIEDVKIVVNGAGAAAISCTKLYEALGATHENIIMLDSKGVITSDRERLDETKRYFATDRRDIHTLEEAIKGADVFLTWLFSSSTGKKIVKDNLGFITPFNTFNDDEMPSDPLAKQVVAWMNNGAKSVPWTFAAIPSEQWKADFGAALLEYINGSMDWAKVESIAKSSWAKEAQIAGR
jgi:hypothetical protein